MDVMEEGSAAPSETVGLQSYYSHKIQQGELALRDAGSDLRRLQAQRNELNARVSSHGSSL